MMLSSVCFPASEAIGVHTTASPWPGSFETLHRADIRTGSIGAMRGSQRARNVLKVMGEDAFSWFNITVGYGPNARTRRQRPLSGRHIAQLKREYLMQGQAWPFEHLSATKLKPIAHPTKWPKGHKHETESIKRQQTIAKNMENMPNLIAESKERKKLPDDISPADRFFMSQKQLYNKYVRARHNQKS